MSSRYDEKARGNVLEDSGLRRLACQKAAKLKPETAEFAGQKPQQDEVCRIGSNQRSIGSRARGCDAIRCHFGALALG